MSWLQRIDKFWMGALIGVLFPAFLFCCYWLIFQHQLNFPNGLMRYLIRGQMLSDVVKLCGLGNLLLFYLGLNKKLDQFNKGIILSVLLYVILVAYLTFFLKL